MLFIINGKGFEHEFGFYLETPTTPTYHLTCFCFTQPHTSTYIYPPTARTSTLLGATNVRNGIPTQT